jgi:hypothetical protein
MPAFSQAAMTPHKEELTTEEHVQVADKRFGTHLYSSNNYGPILPQKTDNSKHFLAEIGTAVCPTPHQVL